MALSKGDQLAAAFDELREAFSLAEEAKDKLAGGRAMLAQMTIQEHQTRARLMEARAKLDSVLGVHVEVALIEERSLCSDEPTYTRGTVTVTDTNEPQYGEAF